MKLSIIKKLGLSTLLFCLSASAFANDIRLGHPRTGGTGCPSGTTSVVLSPDQKSLSILFDDYLVEAGGYERRIARKTCNIAIPVHIPQGYSISIIDVDYRGFVSVPRGGQARFTAEYFFAGSRGPKMTKTFRGPKDKDYLLTSNLGLEALVWSRCGAQAILRANTSMLARSNRRKDEVLATVDSADVTAGLVYHIKWKRCR